MYVKNRHIGESRRLISGVIEIAKIKKLEGFLVSVDIEKAFDSLDHNFLVFTRKKYGFGENFSKRAEVLCYKRRYNYKIFPTCVLPQVRQGDPISAFLFMLAL